MDDPQLQNRMNNAISVLGVDGTYSSLVDDCIPPAGNCFSSSRIAPGKSYYPDLDAAVDNNSVPSFIATEEGKKFLSSIDLKVATDLASGNTIIKKFSGRYFAVYPGANTPYDGPNYGAGGDAFKASEIPD